MKRLCVTFRYTPRLLPLICSPPPLRLTIKASFFQVHHLFIPFPPTQSNLTFQNSFVFPFFLFYKRRACLSCLFSILSAFNLQAAKTGILYISYPLLFCHIHHIISNITPLFIKTNLYLIFLKCFSRITTLFQCSMMKSGWSKWPKLLFHRKKNT